MTCPSCGTIANDDTERCVRCGSPVRPPEHQPDFAIPVLRAPTNRGAAAQLAAGIVGQALVAPTPPRPAPSVTPIGTPIPVPVSADAYVPSQGDAGRAPAPGRADAGRAPAPGRAHAGGAQTAGPADAGRAPARARTATPPAQPAQQSAGSSTSAPAFAVPPPPPALAPHAAPTWHASPAATGDPTLARRPAGSEPTVVQPRGGDAIRGGDATGVLQADPARRSEPAADETRPRPGDDGRSRAPWPPPPGPWSGRRTTRES